MITGIFKIDPFGNHNRTTASFRIIIIIIFRQTRIKKIEQPQRSFSGALNTRLANVKNVAV